MMPHTRLLPLLLAISALTVSAQQSTAIGDSSKKIYWSAHCGESRLVPLKDTVRFPSAEAAEKEGFMKASTCSDGLMPIGPASREAETLTVGELRRASASLAIIRANIASHRRTSARVIGNLTISRYFTGPYERRPKAYYSFSLSDSRGGSGHFYILKGPQATKLQQAATDPVNTLMADCKVWIEGLDEISNLYGKLLDCRIWTVED